MRPKTTGDMQIFKQRILQLRRLYMRHMPEIRKLKYELMGRLKRIDDIMDEKTEIEMKINAIYDLKRKI